MRLCDNFITITKRPVRSTRGVVMLKFNKRVLTVVLSIIALFMALLTVAWFLTRTRAAIAQTTVQLINYQTATRSFFTMARRWPTSATELVSNSMGMIFIYRGPPARDGWGWEILYEPYTTNAGYGRVASYGRDGRPGGVGAD